MTTGADNFADRIIVALDLPGFDQAARMVESIGDSVSFYKVGLELFVRDGNRVLEFLASAGKNVFLDLKLHDIPTTVARAVDSIVAKNVSLTTLHTMGGFEMMNRAAQAASGDLRLLGVTVLTSIDENTLREDLHIQDSIPRMVRELALVAQRAGLHGVVASALELALLRENLPNDFIIVTPGIRPAWAAADDQKRIVTPAQAFERGASYIVIGRPVTGHDNPPDAVKMLHDEIGG